MAEIKDSVSIGELKTAKRRALNIWDKWREVTGVFDDGSSYRWEVEGIIEDAVEIGVQCALGIKRKLSSEE